MDGAMVVGGCGYSYALAPVAPVVEPVAEEAKAKKKR
jgi:hypothetical protein